MMKRIKDCLLVLLAVQTNSETQVRVYAEQLTDPDGIVLRGWSSRLKQT